MKKNIWDSTQDFDNYRISSNKAQTSLCKLWAPGVDSDQTLDL